MIVDKNQGFQHVVVQFHLSNVQKFQPVNDMNHESSWLFNREPYVMAYETIPI